MDNDTTTTAADKVDAGITFLSEREPRRFARVTAHGFNIRDVNKCALGQMYGHDAPSYSSGYDQGITKLGLTFDQACAYGLTAFAGSNAQEWDDLQAAWLNALADRRRSLVRRLFGR